MPAARSLVPTGLACALVVLVFAAAVDALTRGLEHWTFESARRSDALQQRLAASSLVVRTAQGRDLPLWPAASTASADARVYLLDFIYTSCPGVCQTLGAEFAQLQRQLADSPRHGAGVMLLSLSFDLERDGTDELARYAQRHGADGSRWRVAAPLSSADSRRLLQELAVIAVPDGQGGYVHNGAIHLLDGAGRVHAIFDPAQWREALVAATRLAQAGP